MKNPPEMCWRTRGYLPHFDRPGVVQLVTFRLTDSLPNSVLDDLRPGRIDEPSRQRFWRRELALDEGHGQCWLLRPEIANVVEQALLFRDGERYDLHAWVVMPNHVHALVATMPGHSMGAIVQTWKSFTAHRANRLLRRTGVFWYREYYDRFIRDGEHFQRALRYVERNPVRAGLVETPRQWWWSSARRRPPAQAGEDAGGPSAAGEDAGAT